MQYFTAIRTKDGSELRECLLLFSSKVVRSQHSFLIVKIKESLFFFCVSVKCLLLLRKDINCECQKNRLSGKVRKVRV